MSATENIIPDNAAKAYSTDSLSLDEFVWLLRDFVDYPPRGYAGNDKLNYGERIVLIMLKSRGAKIYQTWETLAPSCGMSEPTMGKYIKSAEAKGWLFVDHGKGTHNNRYAIGGVPESVVKQFEHKADKLPEWLRRWTNSFTTVLNPFDYSSKTVSAQEANGFSQRENIRENIRETSQKKHAAPPRDDEPSHNNLFPQPNPSASTVSLSQPNGNDDKDALHSGFGFSDETTPVVKQFDHTSKPPQNAAGHYKTYQRNSDNRFRVAYDDEMREGEIFGGYISPALLEAFKADGDVYE